MFNWNKTHWFAYSLVALMVLNSGCGDTEETTDTATLSSVWDEGTLGTTCASCHSPGSLAGNGPDFSTPTSFVSDLVGKSQADYPTWFISSDCSQSIPFITAGNADASTILSAVVQEDSATMENSYNCSSSYNYHDQNNATITKGSPLYNDLVAWINAGAKNN